MQFADRVSSGVVGSVGFALLAWTLLGTIKKVEDSFNFLWRVEQPRSFARRVAEYLTLLVVGPVAARGIHRPVACHARAARRCRRSPRCRSCSGCRTLAIAIAPYVMVTVFFTGMYMFVPNTRVQWRPALIGAVAGGVLWAAVGKMFTAFVVYSTRLHDRVCRLRHSSSSRCCGPTSAG